MVGSRQWQNTALSAVLSALKDTLVCPLFKRVDGSRELDNFHPASNMVLEEADYLDPFQLGLGPDYNTGKSLIALVGDFWGTGVGALHPF